MQSKQQRRQKAIELKKQAIDRHQKFVTGNVNQIKELEKTKGLQPAIDALNKANAVTQQKIARLTDSIKHTEQAMYR